MTSGFSRAHELMDRLPGFWRLRRIYRRIYRGPEYGEHWSRVVMNRETSALVNSLGPERLNTLEISGQSWAGLPFRNYKSVEYPDFDICAAALDERFDLIIAEQVFEHLQWPYRAGKHVFQMLEPGGHFLITTPFLIRVHDVPIDCSRWTETGLKYFLAECGFDLQHIHSASWGNRACVRGNFVHWPVYRKWLHSIKNEPDYPVVVWALAGKSE